MKSNIFLTSLSWGAIGSFFIITLLLGFIIAFSLFALTRKKGGYKVTLIMVLNAFCIIMLLSILLILAIINGWIVFYSE